MARGSEQMEGGGEEGRMRETGVREGNIKVDRDVERERGRL